MTQKFYYKKKKETPPHTHFKSCNYARRPHYLKKKNNPEKLNTRFIFGVRSSYGRVSWLKGTVLPVAASLYPGLKKIRMGPAATLLAG